jgi:hypothetical protein
MTETENAVYETARNYCSSRDLLQFVPEEQRNRTDLLALARQFAPPGTEHAAEAGCVAGLESIGL